MNIRDATPIDKATLLGFISAIQDAECAVHDSRLPGDQVSEKYYQKLLDHHAIILLAEVEDRAIGFVSGWPEVDDDELQKLEWRQYGLISDIYVTPALRGQGTAQKLLQAMSDKLQQRGITRLRICAIATNRAAVAAYARFGFQPFEVDFDKVIVQEPND